MASSVSSTRPAEKKKRGIKPRRTRKRKTSRLLVWGRILKVGWAFYAMATLVLLAAFNTGTNLLYLILAGLASFIVLSAGLSGWNLRGLRVVREAPRAVQRGQAFLVQVRVENHRRLLPAIGVRVDDVEQPDPPKGFFLKISPRRAAVIQVREIMAKRGVQALPDYRLSSTFPFGLIERWRRFVDEPTVVVYPHVYAVRTTALDQQQGTQYMPQHASADGDEYFGLRAYVPGDDMRHISWRISARLGTWMIREWSRDNSRVVLFVLDTRPAPELEGHEELFEEAVDLVASLSVTMLHRHYVVGVAAPGVVVEPAEGTSQERRILEMLARVTPESEQDFEEFLSEQESRRSAVVVISPNPAQWGARTRTGRRILDPREVVHV